MSSNVVPSDWVVSLTRILEPLEDITSADAFASFISEFGWNITLNDNDFTTIKTALGISGSLSDIVAILVKLNTDDESSFASDIVTLLGKLKDLFSSLPNLSPTTIFSRVPLLQNWSDFSMDVIDYLIYRYFEVYLPSFFGLFRLFGILTANISSDVSNGRDTYLQKRVHLERIQKVFTNFGGLVSDVYNWGSTTNTPNAAFLHLSLLNNIAFLLNGFRIKSNVFPSSSKSSAFYSNNSNYVNQVGEMHSNLISYFSMILNADVSAGLVVFPIPPDNDKSSNPTGIAIGPFLIGATQQEFDISDNIKLSIGGSFGLEGGIIIKFQSTGISIDSSQPIGSTFSGAVKLTASAPTDTPWLLLGSKDSSHIKLSQTHTSLIVSSDESGNIECKVEVGIVGAAIVLNLQGGDGFIKKILPDKPIEIGFDLTIGFSNKKGFYISGGMDLEYKLQLNQSIGPITIDLVDLKLHLDNKIQLLTTINAGAKLGPISASVVDIGLRAILDLNNFDFSLKFKAPSGIGLALNTSFIKGGGFLYIDEPNGRYAGILQLEIKGIGLTAIGLLDTKPPGGGDFSLLIIITAKFPPMQLGFGFTLSGIGGLLGLNRTVIVDVLRDGIKNHTIDSIMFPDNPIENAPKIISDLQAIFPPKQSQFLIGPMVEVGWGTPPIITGDIGIVIELFDPIRIAILGKFKCILPDEDNAILRLHVDVIGIIDFERKMISIDATIYDSKLIPYDLSGDMALRAGWGEQPIFVISVGGLHPKFQPPPGLPKLSRIQISLGTGNNPRLSLDAYFALTSNTLQFGASLDIYAEAFNFSVQGHISFDALIQFNPFGFMIDMNAFATFKWGNTVLGAVSLSIHLSGTRPYHVYGEASISVLLIGTVTVPFDKHWGDETPIVPPSTDIWNDFLKQELEKQTNWSAKLPSNSSRMVSYGDANAGILLDPFGTLVIIQNKVPLNHKISKIGNAIPQSETFFKIDQAIINGTSIAQPPTEQNFFAAGQFFDMSEDEKLSKPDFEKMDAGIRIDYGGVTPDKTKVVETDLQYETIMIDFTGNRLKLPNMYVLKRSDLYRMSLRNKDYRSKFLKSKNTSRVGLSDESFIIVNSKDMGAVPELTIAGQMDKFQAHETMAAFLKDHPEHTGNLQVVSVHEVQAA